MNTLIIVFDIKFHENLFSETDPVTQNEDVTENEGQGRGQRVDVP
jgi:hypothetical protein